MSNPLIRRARQPLSRREVLRYLLGAGGTIAAGGLLGACSSSEPAGAAAGGGAPLPSPAASPFEAMGELQAPDGNGLRLPSGFRSRLIARSGEPVGASAYTWHASPDGAACFGQPDGGWVYVCNSESTPGGVGAIRFDAAGEIVDAYRILDGTENNCAGGRTPWGTWLSCEEVPQGQVWECDPLGAPATAVVRPLLGMFSHEAVAVDPVRKQLFLTEDTPVGRFYRFVPGAADWPAGADRPALQQGALEALLIVGADSAPTTPTAVTWVAVPLPELLPAAPQVPGATSFNGGEGVWYFDGYVYFSTKGDNRVWAYDTINQTIEVLYDVATAADPILSGVDNLVVSEFGDVLVAEDGGDMQVCVILPDRRVKPLLQFVGHDASEVTGPCFSPDGRRLYVSSQRGPTGTAGETYEILLPASACPSACP